MPSKMRVLDRRSHIARTLLAAAAGSWLVTCIPPPAMAQAGAMRPRRDARHRRRAGPHIDGRGGDQRGTLYARQIVLFRSNEPAGTLVVHTAERFVYLVQGNNRALRYGIGVGREGVQWSGLVRVSRKAEWPDWRPPPEMIAASPICRGSWRAVPAIRWVRVRSISDRRCFGLRNQPARNDRSRHFVRLLPACQRRHHRSLRPCAGRHDGRGPRQCQSLRRSEPGIRAPHPRRSTAMWSCSTCSAPCRCVSTALLFASVAPVAAGTLEAVKQRGAVQCGVSEGLFGFSEQNHQGEWSGFDVDFCRAVAGAIFDDPKKVTFVPLSASERFNALRAGRVDLLSRNSTWTLEREAGLGLAFAGITYHDSQGFMIMRDRNAVSALELDGAKVCVETGTTSQLNVADFFRANSMTFEEHAFASSSMPSRRSRRVSATS